MHIIVVGCGRVGAELAYSLFRRGHQVAVADEVARLVRSTKGLEVNGGAESVTDLGWTFAERPVGAVPFSPDGAGVVATARAKKIPSWRLDAGWAAEIAPGTRSPLPKIRVGVPLMPFLRPYSTILSTIFHSRFASGALPFTTFMQISMTARAVS